MERDSVEKHVQESQLQIWQKLMYVSLGSAVAIVFHVTEPLRDIILMVTLLYTTLTGFSLAWGVARAGTPLTQTRSTIMIGHLFASWLVSFGIFSYSRLSALGITLLGYTILLLLIVWRTRKRLSTSEEIFP